MDRTFGILFALFLFNLYFTQEGEKEIGHEIT